MLKTNARKDKKKVILSQSMIVKARGDLIQIQKSTKGAEVSKKVSEMRKINSCKKSKSDLKIRPTSHFVLSQWEGRNCQQFWTDQQRQMTEISESSTQPRDVVKISHEFLYYNSSVLSLKRAVYG